MKSLVVLTILLSTTIVFAGDSTSVLYVGHLNASEALKTGGNGKKSGGALVTAPDPHMRIRGNHSSDAGEVKVYETETATFYVIDGAAILVTGGSVIGPKVTAHGAELIQRSRTQDVDC
jgi:hypothetical protein